MAGGRTDKFSTLVGEQADDSAFAPRHPLLAELRRRHLGVRIPRTEAVLEALVPTILEQKVIGKQARSAYRRLLQELGEPAPGPQPLLLPPSRFPAAAPGSLLG